MADQTVNVFNKFYDLNLNVSANTYEIVLAFFRALTSSDKTAKAYAENLFRIANELNVDVLELLDTFDAHDSMKVSLTMAYYLNSFSDKTVMYGVTNVITPNQVVARNIVQ
jgi:hypothetical protein